ASHLLFSVVNEHVPTEIYPLSLHDALPILTWEKIILDERANFPLYYPIDTNNIGSDRRCLYDVLMKNIQNGNIKNIYDDSYFKRSEEHTSELQSRENLVCRLLLEKKKNNET